MSDDDDTTSENSMQCSEFTIYIIYGLVVQCSLPQTTKLNVSKGKLNIVFKSCLLALLVCNHTLDYWSGRGSSNFTLQTTPPPSVTHTLEIRSV